MNKVDFLIILETKVESFSPITLCNIVGGRLNHWFSLPSQRLAEGILMGWNDSSSSQLDFFQGSFSLSITFHNLEDSFEWWLTGVYGPFFALAKVQFLNELRHIQSFVGDN